MTAIRDSRVSVPPFQVTKAQRTLGLVFRSQGSGYRYQWETYVLRHNADNRRRTCRTTRRSNLGRSDRSYSS
jgi:hypothetical protein